jgi:tyrosine-specific transport protein
MGSAFLIAGTCIGAGMLALPVATAQAGFYTSLMLLVICWAVLYYTGLLVLEANANLPRGVNFISMSRKTLGKGGEIVTWLAFLLLLYALMAAYLSGAGDLFSYAIHNLYHIQIPVWQAALPLLIVVCLVIFLGATFVDYLGRILLLGLIAAYALLIAVTTPHIKLDMLTFGHPRFLFSALAIFATAFGYHIIIPSMRTYLRDDVHKLERAILIGSLIPLIAYIIWELIIFGVIPIYGKQGLLTILKTGDPASHLIQDLSVAVLNRYIPIAAKFFIIFAIASSFLGVAFSLFDFLADGLRVSKKPFNKLWLVLITFLPPYIFILFYPRGFILALSWAGIFVAILHGILPALMVWVERRRGMSIYYRARGGYLALVLVLIFSLLIIASQIILKMAVGC